MGIYRRDEFGNDFEAVQWTGGNLDQVRRFLGNCYGGINPDNNVIEVDYIEFGTDMYYGTQCRIQLNDWVIREFHDHFYTLSPEMFSSLYLKG